ncbi:Rho GTPase-activating protein 21 [Acropora cervicornis]|uniref:Rho GTPase-activating protein 21 n=1 Tax=Acropora cervicornis TaxID=6130 RepID=A0AAD9QH39_ACRCE|nr:Rho GTPase-activating protein 21 [Acropora cervicornis]
MASIRVKIEESELASQQNKDSGYSSFPSPSKLINLQRQSNGFGFTLRHFVVYPPELVRKSSESSPRPGVNGIDHHADEIERRKVEPMDTVFVRQVAPSGPADRAGLSTGDQVVSVNGQSVNGKSYSQVIELIVASQELLELGIIPKEDCVLQMVTPALSVSSKISVSSQDISQSPVNPKPAYRRRSSDETLNKVRSTVTINPSNSYHLRMSEKNSRSVSSLNSDTPSPAVTLRRGSVDRTAMEHRSYVISPDSADHNRNLKSRSSSALESNASSPKMEGSYFMATTDSSGRPLALRFEKGSKVGNTLTVLEDLHTKSRSHSLPVGDNHGQVEQNRVSAPMRMNSRDAVDVDALENNSGPSMKTYPSFTLSSPSLTTTYINTNADVGFRQPVAADPGFQKAWPTKEDSTPRNYVIRAVNPHFNKDYQEGWKSSTTATTLLESKDPHRHRHGNGRWTPVDSSRQFYKDGDSLHPAKVSHQSEDSARRGAHASQISVFPSKSAFEEVSFSPSIANASSEAELSQPNKQGSPKPRRVSYLMATSRANPTPRNQKVRSSSPQDQMSPGKSSVSQALSSLLPPVMRTNRRTSYVMATSSSASPSHQASLETTREEEVCKEGSLWRKLAVVDGGKRSSARSWKPVFGVLRGHVLYLYKDKSSAHQEDGSDEQPISIKSSIVDIAHDYTKRKNVFRLTTFSGSEFLFQSDDQDSMMSWIAALQANNNPDEDENGVSSQSLIIRRKKTVEQETSGSNNTSPSHKLTPPSNKIPGISNFKKSFRNITTGQKGDSGKNHTSKSPKKRKKPQHPNKSFRLLQVILLVCLWSFVRHARLIRVPGNSAAVNALQEELNNRGIENVCLEDEKWHDINNITSLLKLFLRKLPEGLVTADLYEGFIEASKKEDGVQELPDHNFETLKYLVNHLKMVSDNCDKNKMEVRNLAIMFGPTVIRTGDDSMAAMSFPPGHDAPQEQSFCSQNVLSSLGQVAVSFGEDGSYKPKSSGISLHIPKFLGSKSAKSDSGQGSSSDGPLSDSQGSDGSPPAERAPVVRVLSGEGSRSNSPTLERTSRMSGKKITDSSSSSAQLVIDPSDADSRTKGAGSLKAYSYSHPPPPSYRRVNSQNRASSPGTPEQPFAPFEMSVVVGQDSEPKKSLEESRSEANNSPKPSFSSFSEETRRRLLRLNLQKRADEKRRQSEEAISPPFERTEEVLRGATRDFHRKLSDHETFENSEQLSSGSSTSHSSSTHSSKNPSLDSLHVAPQSEKVSAVPIVLHAEAPRVSGKTPANEVLQEAKPRSSETVVAVVKGRGVASGSARLFDTPRRPASLDIPSRREGDLARRSLGSEESSDTSSDEGDECAVSMSKTFDEKLRSFLKLNNSFESKVSDDDKSSVRSDPQKREALNSEEMGKRTSVEQHKGKVYKIVGVNPSKDSSRSSGGIAVSRDDLKHDQSGHELRASNVVQINARKYFANPGGDDQARYSHSPSSGNRVSVEEKMQEGSDIRQVGSRRPRFDSNPNRGSSSTQGPYATAVGSQNRRSGPVTQGKLMSYGAQQRSSPQINQGKVRGLQESFERSSLGKERERVTSVGGRQIGSVRTTTPMSLREVSMQPGSRRAQSSQSGPSMDGRGGMQRSPDGRISSSRSIRLESSPARHSSTTPSRCSAEKNDVSDYRNTRSRLNLPPSRERSTAQLYVGKTQVAPRMMTRDYATRSKPLSHKDSAKELLPSKSRMPSREDSGSQAKRKLEKDAQHIAELLEEMHTERHLHLSRQQSDISGQAQRAAAQRAAMRRRRRSLGDDSDPDAPWQNRLPYQGYEKPQDASREPRSNGVDSRSNGSSRDSYTRSGYHTVTR